MNITCRPDDDEDDEESSAFENQTTACRPNQRAFILSARVTSGRHGPKVMYIVP